MLTEFRNPVMIITKNFLVTRDLDLLSELASHQAAKVAISITTLDPVLQRAMEPRTSSPQRRFEAIEKLAANRELGEEFGRAGSENIATQYDYDRLAEQYAVVASRVAQPQRVSSTSRESAGTS